MSSQGKGGCAAAAGLRREAHGVKARQIARLAASILRRIQQDPALMQYMIRTYINNKSFSTIRSDLVVEIIKQSEGVDLPWIVKRQLIEPLKAQMENQGKCISAVEVSLS